MIGLNRETLPATAFAIASFFIGCASSSARDALDTREDTDADLALPTAAEVSLELSAGRAVFVWSAVSEAMHYQLVEVDARGEERVLEDLAADQTQTTGQLRATLELPALHLRNWAQSYRIDACNDVGCSASESIDAQPTFAGAIGYSGPTSPTGERFGDRLALSEDGTVLAVGALCGVVDAEPAADVAQAVGGRPACFHLDSDNLESGDDADAEPSSGLVGAGVVYVFRKHDGAWVEEARLQASNPDPDDLFGSALAISRDGRTIAVGAHREDSNERGINAAGANNEALTAGAAYVFREGEGGWEQQAYIKASDASAGDQFGFALDLNADGSRLAVGAWRHSRGSGPAATTPTGAVYVYRSNGSAWSEDSTLRPNLAEPQSELLGVDVAISDDGRTIAAGARGAPSVGDEGQTIPGAGAVYVFAETTDLSGWEQQGRLTLSATDNQDRFGWRVDLGGNGNVLAASAVDEDGAGLDADPTNNDAEAAGAVLVFRRDPASQAWGDGYYLKATNADPGDRFGSALTLDSTGSVLAVSSIGEDSAAVGCGGDQGDNGAGDAGAVYVFRYEADNWQQVNYVKGPVTEAGDRFGSWLSLANSGATLGVGAASAAVASGELGGGANRDNALQAGAAFLY